MTAYDYVIPDLNA